VVEFKRPAAGEMITNLPSASALLKSVTSHFCMYRRDRNYRK
jgi:hypothetical protein